VRLESLHLTQHWPSGYRARPNPKPEEQLRPVKVVKEAFMNPGSPWTVYRTRFLVQARQLTEPLVFVDGLGREQSGQPGDYLVESPEGVRRITAKIVFEDIYVPLATAVPGTESGTRGAPGVISRGVSHHA